MTVLHVVAIGFLSRLIVPAVLDTPDRVKIDQKPICPACRVKLEPVVTLPATESFAPMSIKAVDSTGRWFVSSLRTSIGGATRLLGVYDKGGRFLRLLGRPGRGPGEFENPASVAIGAGDTLYVTDHSLKRVSVFSRSLELVRTVTYDDEVIKLLIGPGGEWIVNRYGQGPAILHRTTGKVIRSFDRPVAPLDCGRAFLNMQLGDVGKLWIADSKVFAMTEFDMQNGRQLRQLWHPSPSWFNGCKKIENGPQPYVAPAWYDPARQRLWLWTDSPVQDFAVLIRAREKDPDLPARPLAESALEIIDLRAGRVFMSQRFPFMGGSLRGADDVPYATVYNESDQSVSVFRAVLVGEKK
jgi:hypothetical protein